MKKKDLAKILGFALLVLLLLFTLPYIFTLPNFTGIDFSKTGNIGDTFGGILGPFIAIVAAVLTFFAFYIQYQANEQQKGDLKIERFENKFYELLKLHKTNVDEMKIGSDIQGRNCFIYMFRELRFCYNMCVFAKHYALPENKDEFEKINIMSFAYKLFFYGISINSEKHYYEFMNNEEKKIFRHVKELLNSTILEPYNEHRKSDKTNPYVYTFSSPSQHTENSIEFNYYPYQGHINKLGHYYRHLFQTAKFIKENDFLKKPEKYEYIKTLRAQLTDFEQLLLYYNSLAWFKDEWRELFIDYRLIKNIPIPLADFDINPIDLFEKEIKEYEKKGIALFEFHE
jgi:Putative phage abortive infection protein